MKTDFTPSLLIALVMVLTISAVYLLDRWHRRRVKRIFQNFSCREGERLSRENRSVPRVSVPAALEVKFCIRDDRYPDRGGKVVDLSLAGLAVEPDFPLKKLPLDIEILDVVVETPIGCFSLEKVRAVRVEHQLGKRILAFKILAVSEVHFSELQKFIVYLDAFSKT